MTDTPRYFVAAYANGWGIHDREKPVDALGRTGYVQIERFWDLDYGRDWNATHQAALVRLEELNRG